MPSAEKFESVSKHRNLLLIVENKERKTAGKKNRGLMKKCTELQAKASDLNPNQTKTKIYFSGTVTGLRITSLFLSNRKLRFLLQC